VRGAGLAYGLYVGVSSRRGELIMKINRSPNAYAAWEEVRKIVSEIVEGKVSRFGGLRTNL